MDKSVFTFSRLMPTTASSEASARSEQTTTLGIACLEGQTRAGSCGEGLTENERKDLANNQPEETTESFLLKSRPSFTPSEIIRAEAVDDDFKDPGGQAVCEIAMTSSNGGTLA